jgi:hypothetical protein
MGIAPWVTTPTNLVTLLDNSDTNGVTITGDWTSSTYAPGFWGQNYIHDDNTGKGAKSVRFTPNLPYRADYRVYLRWTAGSNRATNAPVDINHADGTDTLLINETINGSQWVCLGTFPFALGQMGSVLVRNTGTTGHVIVDAVAFAADFPLDPAFTGDPWKDTDGDGICNYVEYLNATDPQDPTSFLNVRLDMYTGTARLGFIAQAGRSYTIQYRDSLGASPWQTMTNLAATGVTCEMQLLDTVVSAKPTRFYRLMTPAQPGDAEREGTRFAKPPRFLRNQTQLPIPP